MEDDEITLINACTDLVTNKAAEAFPRRLLGHIRRGEWVGVRDFCAQVGVAPAGLKAELFATWLPDPAAHDAYAVILFYDDETKWSMAAQYNRGRILGSAALNQAVQQSRTAIPAPGATSQPAAPAADR